jgi:hypothetical protein
MPHYLVIFDSEAHTLVGDGSNYFLKKCIIEAKSPEDAVKNALEQRIDAEVEMWERLGQRPTDEQDAFEIMRLDIRKSGTSVVEIANTQIHYFSRRDKL